MIGSQVRTIPLKVDQQLGRFVTMSLQSIHPFYPLHHQWGICHNCFSNNNLPSSVIRPLDQYWKLLTTSKIMSGGFTSRLNQILEFTAFSQFEMKI